MTVHVHAHESRRTFRAVRVQLLHEGVELAETVKNYECVVGNIHDSYYSHDLVEADEVSQIELC